MANEFTRIAHTSGGSQLVDINPNVNKESKYGLYISGGFVSLPVQGYSKVRLKLYSGSKTCQYKEIYSDGTSGSTVQQSLTGDNYYELTPTSGTVAFQFDVFTDSSSNYIYYGLIV